ncbi:MAG: hypothetical protein JW709_08065 [Sedimentisphaerales bacterium]|nr:hypothetical protein [Sedimentisphaerales bacterium]
MSLSRYIRDDQAFLIYLRSPDGTWRRYDSAEHGPAGDIKKDYVVAYLNGEVLEAVPWAEKLPEGLYYTKTGPRQNIAMPECGKDDLVAITHYVSPYHRSGRYATCIYNKDWRPIRIRRFGFFRPSGTGKRYKLSTITNDWFSGEQFRYWYNQHNDWIMPHEKVTDHDNYGFGGYWVYEVDYGDKSIFVKSKAPSKLLFTESVSAHIHLASRIFLALTIVLTLAETIIWRDSDVLTHMFLGAMVCFLLYSIGCFIGLKASKRLSRFITQSWRKGARYKGFNYIIIVYLVYIMVSGLYWGLTSGAADYRNFILLQVGAGIYCTILSIGLIIWRFKRTSHDPGSPGLSGPLDLVGPSDDNGGPLMNPVPAPLEPTPPELKAAAEVAVPEEEPTGTPVLREGDV